MGRGDLERLSKEELIELVLRLQRPEKTSRPSSKPPSTDRKEQREKSKPGGAKPGHEGHSRVMSAAPDAVVEHRGGQCSGCGAALPADESMQNRGVIMQLLAVPDHWLQAGSPDSDGGRRPQGCRSARPCARSGRAAPLLCSSASAAPWSCAWPRSR